MVKQMSKEVLTIMLHFILSLALLGAYLYTVGIGQPDETLKNLLMVIGGYWFGVIGPNLANKNKGGASTQGTPPEGDKAA